MGGEIRRTVYPCSRNIYNNSRWETRGRCDFWTPDLHFMLFFVKKLPRTVTQRFIRVMALRSKLGLPGTRSGTLLIQWNQTQHRRCSHGHRSLSVAPTAWSAAEPSCSGVLHRCVPSIPMLCDIVEEIWTLEWLIQWLPECRSAALWGFILHHFSIPAANIFLEKELHCSKRYVDDGGLLQFLEESEHMAHPTLMLGAPFRFILVHLEEDQIGNVPQVVLRAM